MSDDKGRDQLVIAAQIKRNETRRRNAWLRQVARYGEDPSVKYPPTCTNELPLGNTVKELGYGEKWEETPKGILHMLFSAQVINSKRRGHPPPTYTLAELIDRYLNDPVYLKIYTTWLDGDKNRNFKPSLDRLDDSKGYSLDNIRVTTWYGNYSKNFKPVVVYKGSELVGAFHTFKAAKKYLGFTSHRILAKTYLDTDQELEGYTFVSPEAAANRKA